MSSFKNKLLLKEIKIPFLLDAVYFTKDVFCQMAGSFNVI